MKARQTRLVSFNLTVEDMAKLIGAVKLQDGQDFCPASYFCHGMEFLIEWAIFTKYGDNLEKVPEKMQISGSDIPDTRPDWHSFYADSIGVGHGRELTQAVLAPFDRIFKIPQGMGSHEVFSSRYLDATGVLTPFEGAPFGVLGYTSKIIRQRAIQHVLQVWGPKELMCVGSDIEILVWKK